MKSESTPHVIRTPRLELVALPAALLQATVDGDLSPCAHFLNATVPEEWREVADLARLRLEQLQKDPALGIWLLRALVLRNATGAREVVGLIGCHDGPGGAWLAEYAPGGIEIGYILFPAHRRHGYATEALGALLDWAHREQDITRFVLSISPDNAPSQRLAARFGFRKIGEQEDPEDGLEEVFLLERPDSAA